MYSSRSAVMENALRMVNPFLPLAWKYEFLKECNSVVRGASLAILRLLPESFLRRT